MDFKLHSKYTPNGDQPNAIKQLVEGLKNEKKHQVLLGATGTGKTFTIANVINQFQQNTLILVHNKTLASQLYSELKAFFPENRVEYFVSYFDYYQPESYVVGKDLYIEKSSDVNDEIDRMRHLATVSLLQGEKTIIVASVSCIYGLGEPTTYKQLALNLSVNQQIDQSQLIYKLIDMQYERNDIDFKRLKFRVRGDIIEVVSAYSDDEAFRIEFFGDEIDSISIVDLLTGKKKKTVENMVLFPASHYVNDPQKVKAVLSTIRHDMEVEVAEFIKQGKVLEAQRLEQRTNYDLEMMDELGFVNGIENYTRYFTDKKIGEAPYTLLDYFGDEWLLVVDESHVSLPQVRGMYEGDRRRKQNLVDYGFRLKAAMDNRPLKFSEFTEKLDKVIYTTATPGSYELELTNNEFVQQIIRPTGLLDPIIEIIEKENQIDKIIEIINNNLPNKTLITTLTKKMAEDLSTYFKDFSIKAEYLHSEIGTIERVKIINQLRSGKYDVLIGINLLREGLDIPEVSRVIILDADKQGFLRSSTALIQTIGRAARNVDGKVIMFADKISDAMQIAIEETTRRRNTQIKHNLENNITPVSVTKSLDIISDEDLEKLGNRKDKEEHKRIIKELKKEMDNCIIEMNFERAAEIRDLLFEIES